MGQGAYHDVIPYLCFAPDVRKLPYLQKVNVPLLFTQLVRQHDWNFIYYWIIPVAFSAKEDAFFDYLSFRKDLEQLQRVVLVYWACKDVKHRLFHYGFRSRYTGEPVSLDRIAASATRVTLVASAAVTTIFPLPSIASTKFVSSRVSGSWNCRRGTIVASARSIFIS